MRSQNIKEGKRKREKFKIIQKILHKRQLKIKKWTKKKRKDFRVHRNSYKNHKSKQPIKINQNNQKRKIRKLKKEKR